MRGMASFIAGFGNGYFKAQDKKYERERQEKQDAWQEEQQGRQRKEWDRADRLESDLQAAGTPLTVEQPNDVLKDDDGNDMPAVPPLRVGTQRYATMEEATKAAADANTPEAQNKRMVQAYRNAGQFDKALTMENQLRQGEAADMQLANLKFQEKLGNWMGGGFDGFRDGINAYEGGPFKGKKIDFITSPDGKTRTVGIVGADGEVAPTALTVPNTQEGLIQLGFLLDKTVKPADRLTMYRQERKDELEAQKVAIQERLAAAREKQVDAMSFRLMSGGGGSGGGGSGGGGARGGSGGAVGWKERREVFNDFGSLLPDPKNATTPQEAEKIQASNTQALAKADTLFSTNAQFGNVLTAPQLRAAMVQAEASPQSIRTQVDAESGMAVKYVVVNGARVIVDVGTAAAQKQEAPASKQDAATGGKTDTANPSPKPAPAPYVPPADSPAGKAKAAREAAQKAAQQQQMQRIATVTAAAAAAVASKDPAAAQAVQDMPGFDSLPTAQKAEIRRIVFGR